MSAADLPGCQGQRGLCSDCVQDCWWNYKGPSSPVVERVGWRGNDRGNWPDLQRTWLSCRHRGASWCFAWQQWEHILCLVSVRVKTVWLVTYSLKLCWSHVAFLSKNVHAFGVLSLCEITWIYGPPFEANFCKANPWVRWTLKVLTFGCQHLQDICWIWIVDKTNTRQHEQLLNVIFKWHSKRGVYHGGKDRGCSLVHL